MKYSIKFGSESYQIFFDCRVPEYYKYYFKDFVTAYYHSAKKKELVSIGHISKYYKELLEEYYLAEKIPLKEIRSTPREIPKDYSIHYTPNPDKHVVMFTSGKDSLHLLLRLIEEFGKENILALYCSNINKSENYYETKAVKKICAHLGVRWKIIKVTNSIRLNRTNHNIGLREQLTLGTALPYILSWRAKHVWYGVYRAFDDIMSGVFSHHKSAFEIATGHLKEVGVDLTISNHIDYPIQNIMILKFLIEKHRDIFFMSSSCYSQLNFREMHHRREQKKYPDIELYHGCGICLKCLIANGGILLFDKKAQMAPGLQRDRLKNQIIRGYKSKHPDDGALKQIYDMMMTGKCESFVDR